MEPNRLNFRVWHFVARKMIYNLDDVLTSESSHFPILISELSRLPQTFVPMQSTGLLDINGKEIYEGDIVKRHLERYDSGQMETDYGVPSGEALVQGAIGTVGWSDRFAEFYFGVIRGHPWSFHDPEGTAEWHPSEKRLEVIGNIYENPDLLGVD